MRAVSIARPGTVTTVDLQEPELGPDDVLLSIRFIGLCGSDLNAFRGLSPNVTYPLIPGHEIGAVVAAKGDRVPDSVHIGARVTVSPYSSCGDCPACRAGRRNCCQFNRTLGVQRDGALTERISVHYADIVSSDVLTLQELALVEPMTVGYHAANRGRASEVDTVLVIGCGAIGMGAIAAAARKGATVIAADIDDGKLALSERFGARHTVNSSTCDLLGALQDQTDGDGVSVVIEAVGLPGTYRLAVEAAAYAGRVVYVGYAKQPVTYDSTEFVRKELDIMGSRNALLEFPAVVAMIERREFPFADLITRVVPLDEAAQAFVDWDAAPGQIVKVMIQIVD